MENSSCLDTVWLHLKNMVFLLSDNTVHYFIILIRNGPHVIFTQMLSTHDKNMRGSLDFPNLIKIHGISGKFSLVLEIYSMVSVLSLQFNRNITVQYVSEYLPKYNNCCDFVSSVSLSS